MFWVRLEENLKIVNNFFKIVGITFGSFNYFLYISFVGLREIKTLKNTIMSYTTFDRHEEMSSETRSEIMELLNQVKYSSGFELTNMIYGLFDGYLYDRILTLGSNELDKVTYGKLESIVSTIKQYPVTNLK